MNLSWDSQYKSGEPVFYKARCNRDGDIYIDYENSELRVVDVGLFNPGAVTCEVMAIYYSNFITTDALISSKWASSNTVNISIQGTSNTLDNLLTFGVLYWKALGCPKLHCA